MNEIQQMSLDAIYARYQAGDADDVWIDVRRPEEWAEGTIPGVKRIILDDLPDRLDELDKSKSYVLVCRSGARSNRACQLMADEGFTQLTNFAGGMLDWYAAGYELEN